jgi:phasin family protein
MADAAETVKKTIEQNTAKAQAQAESIQAAGAKAFREGVDKSVASLTELNAHGKKNLEAVVESASAAQTGAEALSQQALAYTKKSWEDGVAAAQSFSQARSVQELIELQSNWAKSAAEAYLAQFGKATETLTASVKDSFKPINERVSATVEQFQAGR